MSDTIIYHNPKCGTSRNTLALIRNAGIEPQVILYLETPPSRAQLVQLVADCGLSVREVLERLRADARTELLPVVILTSSDEQKDRLKSYENGCNSFVQKPVDFADFAETVARLGVYWLATNEPPPERPLQR